MARVRSGARYAPRFNRQFGEGFQFRPERQFMFTYGPWQEIIPDGINKDLPSNALRCVTNGMIERGSVRNGLSVYSVVQHTNRLLLGVYDILLSIGLLHVVFYSDLADGNKLKIETTNAAGTVTVYTTPIIGITERVAATGWQNSIFFSSENIGGVYRYDLTPALTLLAGTVGALHLFMLDNNLCEVYRHSSALYWEIRWSVDSLPNDFVNAGSGRYIVSSNIYNVTVARVLNNKAVLIGQKAGLLMEPTGTLPAFRFTELNGCTGTEYPFTSASDGGAVYYIDRAFRLVRYTLDQEVQLGSAEDRFLEEPKLYYSFRQKKLVVVRDQDIKYMDAQTGKWVAGPVTTMDMFGGAGSFLLYAADVPGGVGEYTRFYYTGVGTTNGYGTVTVVSGTSTAGPTITTGFTKFPQPIQISHVDVSYKKDANILYYWLEANFMYDDGTTEHFTFEPAAAYTNVNTSRFWIDRQLWGAEFILKPKLGGAWDKHDAIEGITVYARGLTNETLESL